MSKLRHTSVRCFSVPTVYDFALVCFILKLQDESIDVGYVAPEKLWFSEEHMCTFGMKCPYLELL